MSAKVYALSLILAAAGIAAVWAEAVGPLSGSGGGDRGSSSDPGRSADRTSTRPSVPRWPRLAWRDSRALGAPAAGSLLRGVRLPREGRDFFTWDPVRRTWGNRVWRRFGADGAIRRVLRVLRAHRRAHEGAPRVGIGDISRPRGGDFGARYGLPGHATHQNGLDVDLYYPRRDRRERAPTTVGEIDRRLSQDLVDRFVAARTELVLVGPATGLTGPAGVVVPLVNHDNHLHVRFPPRLGAPP